MIHINNYVALKPIELNDQPKLVKLLERIYPPSYKHLWKNEDCSWYINTFFNKDNLKLELEDNNAEYYFVLFLDKYCGIIRVVYDRPYGVLPDKKATYFHRIYLGEEAQGKGVAKAIFDWAEHKAHLKGSEIMWLKAMDTQQQALKFYIKQGFTNSGNTILNFDLLHKPLRGMVLMHKVL